MKQENTSKHQKVLRVGKLKCMNWEVCRHSVGSAQKKLCWNKWRLCGICAVLEHPEFYEPRYVRKIKTKLERDGRIAVFETKRLLYGALPELKHLMI